MSGSSRKRCWGRSNGPALKGKQSVIFFRPQGGRRLRPPDLPFMAGLLTTRNSHDVRIPQINFLPSARAPCESPSGMI